MHKGFFTQTPGDCGCRESTVLMVNEFGGSIPANGEIQQITIAKPVVNSSKKAYQRVGSFTRPVVGLTSRIAAIQGPIIRIFDEIVFAVSRKLRPISLLMVSSPASTEKECAFRFLRYVRIFCQFQSASS